MLGFQYKLLCRLIKTWQLLKKMVTILATTRLRNTQTALTNLVMGVYRLQKQIQVAQII